MLFRCCLAAVLLGSALAAQAQSETPAQTAAPDRAAGLAIAFARASQHLRRGINASHWFSQNPGDYSAQHTDTETTPEDIATMAKLGFDNVRLSIDAAPLEQYPRGADGLNDDFAGRLDRAVDTILADGMAVTIDLHPEDNYKQQLRTDNAAVDRLVALWRKLAAHYAGRDPDRVFFEILNEPEVNDPYRWAGIQARVAAAIREAAPANTIIATGPNYSDIVDLLGLHPLEDGNVIYNFHFYDPHEFTHQGATWSTPWWRYEHGIPYPPTASSMQALLMEIPGRVDRFQLENYWLDDWNADHIRRLIDEAAGWALANHVPLICNEFGVYRAAADPVSRTNWIRDVRSALEADGIGWAMWDYHNGFGVAVRDKDGKSVVDPQTVEALGLRQLR
ncbi:MAG TPA: cellulase family glycosylhydrolase [Terracidiphilus sp.]|nr:cellulase family glycosylhydrolase [Terracidiphilus sp.]